MSLAKHFIQRSKSNEGQVTRVSGLNLEGKLLLSSPLLLIC